MFFDVWSIFILLSTIQKKPNETQALKSYIKVEKNTYFLVEKKEKILQQHFNQVLEKSPFNFFKVKSKLSANFHSPNPPNCFRKSKASLFFNLANFFSPNHFPNQEFRWTTKRDLMPFKLCFSSAPFLQRDFSLRQFN